MINVKSVNLNLFHYNIHKRKLQGLNMEELRERIEMLISTKGLTNATFAEKIGVQPSNISHVLSGRNKASLDLVMKILNSFKEIRTEWLLHGKGSMTWDYTLFDAEEIQKEEPDAKNDAPISDLQSETKEIEQPSAVKSDEKPTKFTDNKEDKALESRVADLTQKIEKENPYKSHDRKIERIVIFYEDRGFKEYFPEN